MTDRVVVAIRGAAARRAGRQVRLVPKHGGVSIVWSRRIDEGIRVLMLEHCPCVICGRRTRWAAIAPANLSVRAMLAGEGMAPPSYPRYCSDACLRTRPP